MATNVSQAAENVIFVNTNVGTQLLVKVKECNGKDRFRKLNLLLERGRR